MLEEIEMPVALGLCVVNRMQAFRGFVRKTAAFGEIDADGQQPLPGVKLDIAYIPGAGDAKGRREKFVAHDHTPTGLPDAAAPAVIRMPLCSRPSRTSPAGGRRRGHS
jgi:hypothetical protein